MGSYELCNTDKQNDNMLVDKILKYLQNENNAPIN